MRLSLLPVLLLPACAGLFAPEPEEGDYDVDMEDLDASSACRDWGFDLEDDDRSETIEVEVDDDEIVFVDWYEDCEREYAEFACEDGWVESETFADLTVVFEATLEGRWTSPTTFEAEMEAVWSCSGDDCGGIDDCELTGTWTGELDD